jgi:hypothetical protein
MASKVPPCRCRQQRRLHNDWLNEKCKNCVLSSGPRSKTPSQKQIWLCNIQLKHLGNPAMLLWKMRRLQGALGDTKPSAMMPPTPTAVALALSIVVLKVSIAFGTWGPTFGAGGEGGAGRGGGGHLSSPCRRIVDCLTASSFSSMRKCPLCPADAFEVLKHVWLFGG